MSNPRSPEPPLRCLHLGDSYTCAEGIPVAEGWPFQLASRLSGHGIRIEKTEIRAQTGWTSADLLKSLQKAELPSTWDWITLCIGVNNQYRGGDPASFGLELEQLVQEARGLLWVPNGRLHLLSIPDWGVSPFAADRDPTGISESIDIFNAVVRTVSLKTQVPFLDWTPISRQFAGQPEAFAADGLHPSARQHAAWADFLAESQLGY